LKVRFIKKTKRLKKALIKPYNWLSVSSRIKKRSVSISLLALVLALASCKSIEVYTYYDHETDFSSYQTYSFTAEAKQIPLDSAIRHHVLTATRRELSKRGYEEVESGPDLYVNLWGQRQTRLRANTYSNASGQTFSFDQSAGLVSSDIQDISYQQGSIWVEMIDHKNGKKVWHGVGVGFVEDKYTNAINMIKAVQKMFKREPFRKM